MPGPTRFLQDSLDTHHFRKPLCVLGGLDQIMMTKYDRIKGHPRTSP